MLFKEIKAVYPENHIKPTNIAYVLGKGAGLAQAV
jgi:hypothetical protein